MTSGSASARIGAQAAGADRAGGRSTARCSSVTWLDPLRGWLRHWAAIAEIERHPDLAFRYHHAEQVDTVSDDPRVRARGVRVTGELLRAAYAAVDV
ncbi:hypothetical protein [Embleya sp. NPDC001921]